MKRALITTTINVPHVLKTWAEQLQADDIVVVAGDMKTPHEDVIALLRELPCETSYLHPGFDTEWGIEYILGYDTIQRRNLALLEALVREPDYIITVDDDNEPCSDWVSRVDDIFLGRGESALVAESRTGWFDAGELCSPHVTHRGFPLSQRSAQHWIHGYARTENNHNIGVFASLWTGAADVDAIWRAQHGDQVDDVWDDAVLASGTWCPFNSQATAFRRELAPALLMWPGVGRYDDIWASYLCRVVTDLHDWLVRYGRPTVQQDRNPHNIMNDMRAEMLGYEFTDDLVQRLRRSVATLYPTTPVVDLVAQVFSELLTASWLPEQTIRGFAAWVADMRRLEAVYGVSFERRELTP